MEGKYGQSSDYFGHLVPCPPVIVTVEVPSSPGIPPGSKCYY